MNDLQQIEQLNARYNFAFDQGGFAEWLDYFTPDGRFERTNGDGPSVGREDLEAMAHGFTVKGRHITSGSIIDVEGDSARQVCYLQWLMADSGHAIGMFGIYRDELVRVDGEWKFASRHLEVL